MKGTSSRFSMADLYNCPPIWSKIENRLPLQAIKFEETNVKFIVLLIGCASLFIIWSVFIWKDQGVTVMRAIYNSNRGSKIIALWCLKPFILHFVPEALDTYTDVFYFFQLDSMRTLVDPGHTTTKIMTSFLCLTLIKDFLCTKWFIEGLYWYTRHGETEMETEFSAKDKVKKLIMSAMLEDIAQVLMQYYFFEKFMLKMDVFSYINGALMVIQAILFFMSILKPVEVKLPVCENCF